MSRYIELTKVLSELGLDHKDYVYIDKHEVAERIKKIPSIDIVRCAECKYWRNTDAEKIPTASIACGNMHADDFCSYGQKGDENVETD